MKEHEIFLELQNGQQIGLNSRWEITDTDSYPIVEICDCETNECIASFKGALPDIDDPDFDLDRFVQKIEDILKDETESLL